MTTAQQSGPTPAQVCMTLSAIAASGATRRPSGETRHEHEQRIMLGIRTQLADPSLATGGTWQLLWFGLTPDNGNLAYIAGNSAVPGEFAVAVRGTVFSNVIDLLEDFEVGTAVPFDTGGALDHGKVSKGAMDAFRSIVKQRGASLKPEGAEGAGAIFGRTLAEALEAVTAPVHDATVYVTGHSLGGCLATMLAPYLKARPRQAAQFALLTFAAPTAGLQSFADYVESVPWSLQERHVNAYDLVPMAWADITAAEKWYPTPPGPKADDEVSRCWRASPRCPGPTRTSSRALPSP
ncbi:lipase family protein [Streptomyces sp. NPDC017890]|uniref:lipase family protein n=1 Tax=Streptomyces sp. NPDC017890 TaxID=3365015 RepID=UPI00379A4646